MELHHLGLDPGDVPPVVVLVTAGLAAGLADQLEDSPVRRREYTSGRLRSTPEVLVVGGPLGAPATVIALEELRRAGASALVLVTRCRCLQCENGTGAHGTILPRGAVRGEGTSESYAPAGFPAVPDHRLLLDLHRQLGVDDFSVVHSVDVAPQWLPDVALAPGVGEPVDLESAAVLVAAAAGGMIAASVVVGRASGPGLPTILDAAARSLLAQVAVGP